MRHHRPTSWDTSDWKCRSGKSVSENLSGMLSTIMPTKARSKGSSKHFTVSLM